VVFRTVGVVPEADRHHRERAGTDQFALFTAHRPAQVVEHLDGHAQPGALDFAAMHRAVGIADDEAGNDVGAARDRRKLDVPLDARIDVVETFGDQRAAGREHGAQGLQAVGLARLEIDLGDGVDELGRGAEMRHGFGVGIVEQDVAATDEGRAVIKQQGCARGKAGHQPVPHHPAAGGEVEQAVIGMHVALQLVFLDVLQQRAAGAMDDALGHTGGARGIHDVERMVEGQLLEADAPLVGMGGEEIRQ
jgi:hypothetical protein